jgi:hypothetical protein
MSELLEKMKSIFNDIGEVTITEEFILLRNEKRGHLRQGDRSDIKFTKDVDCLMLEDELIACNLVGAPLQEHYTKSGACVYDCRVNLLTSIAYIDFKCIGKNLYYNVSKQKLKTHRWVQTAVDEGLLTDYCFYRMHRPEDRPLQVGDVVWFELINVLNSEYVLDSLKPSRFGGKFYKVPKYDC